MSVILDLNQGLPRYKQGTLPTELMTDFTLPEIILLLLNN